MSANYVAQVGKNYEPDPSEPILPGLFQQYERVLVESLVSSFALDFLVKDQHGGDVDTILNVRKIDQDDQMTYKNVLNKQAYEQIEQYSKAVKSKYDSDPRFTSISAEFSRQKKAGELQDAYTGQKVARNANIDVDHVISTEEIHNDRGRVLSKLNGLDLANSEENLRPTDRSINRSMQNKTIDEYCEWLKNHQPERMEELERLRSKPQSELTDKERGILHKYEQQEAVDQGRMKMQDEIARKSYEAKLAKAYYTSPEFAKDVAKAAGNVSVRMGVRQALGFIFAEMWFAVKEEFTRADKEKDFDLGDFLSRIRRGLKRGLESAKKKYATLFSRILNGAVAGALSSVTTTLCNIFFTTAKNVVRMIRQVYPSLVEAIKVLFINPECLTFGERMRTVAKILATGASIVMGVAVSDIVGKTPIATIPVVGEIVPAFCGAFTSGIMSCTLLYFLDRSPMINQLVKTLDKMHTIDAEVNYFREYAEYFECYAANLMAIDLEQFRRETTAYHNTAVDLENAKTEQELNRILKNAYETLHLSLPWKGEFDTFMQNKTQHLVFE